MMWRRSLWPKTTHFRPRSASISALQAAAGQRGGRVAECSGRAKGCSVAECMATQQRAGVWDGGSRLARAGSGCVLGMRPAGAATPGLSRADAAALTLVLPARTPSLCAHVLECTKIGHARAEGLCRKFHCGQTDFMPKQASKPTSARR